MKIKITSGCMLQSKALSSFDRLYEHSSVQQRLVGVCFFFKSMADCKQK